MRIFQFFLKNDSGQAVVEFFLLVFAVIAVVGLLRTGIKNLTVKIWSYLAKKIAAPCPTCGAGDEFNL